MESPVASVLDFSSFVKELSQSPLADYAISANSSRNCCEADSFLSKKFEGAMQKLICNYELDDDNTVATDTCTKGNTQKASAFCDKENHNESLATTVDFDEEPLELTGEEFDESGEGSSDEQQHSRSLSLSYSLSFSHAQENFSQYSQSTDKGLSKRYDSPCSYEDDRESECSNFDKLDDWNDFISDMQNNNGADAASRDFREYYDEYVAGKGQPGPSTDRTGMSDDSTYCEIETKESSNLCGKTETMVDAVPRIIPGQQTSSIEKCRSFLEYRNPSNEMEDDLMAIEEDVAELSLGHSSSFKRKFRYDDCEDYEYEVTTLITEKFHKTDFVPDHGSHEPISLIDDEQFARLTNVESICKTPIPSQHVKSDVHCGESITDDPAVLLDDEEEAAVATTPTHQRMFENTTDDIKASQKPYNKAKNKYSKNDAPTARSAIRPVIDLQAVDSSSAHQRVNLNTDLIPKADVQSNFQ
ncbi:uncharacterized protein LOC128737249 [Sabethes cyaneus]|uniref:uncharacterized protein LOC128737249 n=1 Tax=Sabethes cyaneus TaxID=53552 RepID=UPI00237E632A|nr:uncharacterized protein LOC128737249 [Sabethes cyaneus]